MPMNALTRRQFLGAAAGTAAAALAGAPAAANEPVRRTGPSRIKLSLAAYSYRDYLQGKAEPRMTLPEFIDRAAAMPLDAVELTEYYFPKPLTSDYIARIKRQCYLLGLDISGSPMGNTFTYPPGEKRDKEIARVREWIDRCAELGSPCIRIFAGSRQPGQTLAEAQKCAVECIETCCEYAAQKGILLALENHGGIVADAEGVLAIVKAVKSDYFGVNLDTGNFHTEDPYGDMAKCAPYAVVAQIKTEVQAKGLPKQEGDLNREVRILKDAGYRGYIALEYEAAEEPLKAVPRYIDRLRSLL
jgi:sugar phosphate isomerase/epimerase